MENLLMQYRNNNGLTYRKMARQITTILRKSGEKLQVSHESVEDYAKSNKEPREDIVSKAIAEYIGTTTKDFLAILRACKKAG